MNEIYGSDAFSPQQIAERVQNVGVVKARLALRPMFMLSVLAGLFIGLGSLYFTLIVSDTTLGFAAGRVLGGVAFSLGLFLVVVAGAELFTGNNLLVMAWAAGRIRLGELARNWCVVLVGNAVGAVGLAVLVFASGHTAMNQNAIAVKTLQIAVAKCALSPTDAFLRGVLCNILVCLAVWMALAGRSVVDKLAAIVLPVSAFVAAGFEHSVANLYFLPLALLIRWQGAATVQGIEALTVAAVGANLLWVVLGNIVGGSVGVAATYFVIYREAPKPTPAANPDLPA